MKSLFLTMLFGLILGMTIYFFKSGIVHDVVRGYHIVQLINKGDLKTITNQEYIKFTRYQNYFDSFEELKIDDMEKMREKWEKKYGQDSDGPSFFECVFSISNKCDL
tara:strand:- start:92 stop:412 length:321 start_codon:yes stop_codon:yes gene_type:complete